MFGSDSEIHDCEFVLCGILNFFFGNSIDIRGCSFFNSTGSNNGGAIYIMYYSVVNILNTVFQYCSANNDGGAIYFGNSYSNQSRLFCAIYIFYLFLGIWKMFVSSIMCMINFFFLIFILCSANRGNDIADFTADSSYWNDTNFVNCCTNSIYPQFVYSSLFLYFIIYSFFF
jgi:hypothetical protein